LGEASIFSLIFPVGREKTREFDRAVRHSGIGESGLLIRLRVRRPQSPQSSSNLHSISLARAVTAASA
jgi:hypothetical protein